MRSYTIDDLTPEDCEKIREYLNAQELQGSLPGIFWLPVDQCFFTAEQNEHANKCGPYAMAFEVEDNFVRLEFLVRGRNALHCNCVGYACPPLEQAMMRKVESIFASLSIAI